VKRLALAAVVAGAVLVPTGVSASATGSYFRIAGSHSASADFVLSRSATFDLGKAESHGSGQFVGFYVESIDRPYAERDADGRNLGLVTLRDFHPPGEPSLTLGLGVNRSHILQPGRYRAYLLADGPSSVSVPISGSLGLTLKPQRPERAVATVQTDILTSPLAAANRQPIRLTGSRTLAVSSIVIGRFRAYAGQIAACVTKPEGDCGEATNRGVDGTYTGWMVSPLNDMTFGFTLEYGPGVLPPGSYESVQTALNATTLQFASGAAFALTLS
jgi:hypothetical protein